MDVGTLYDSAPRKERYSYPSGTVYGRLYVMLLVIEMFPLENSFAISFLFSVSSFTAGKVFKKGIKNVRKFCEIYKTRMEKHTITCHHIW